MVYSGSELVNATLRLTVLQPSGPVFEARVERGAGRRISVAYQGTLQIGAAVQLDAPDRILFAEVLSVEPTPNGALALLDVQQFLLHSDIQDIRSRWQAPEAAG
jgi:hypothetical protein